MVLHFWTDQFLNRARSDCLCKTDHILHGLPSATHLQTGGQVAIRRRLPQGTRPLIGLSLSFRGRDSVSFLNPPDQLVLFSGDGLPVVVREFSPALLCRSDKLLPLAFDLIPIHLFFLFKLADVHDRQRRYPQPPPPSRNNTKRIISRVPMTPPPSMRADIAPFEFITSQ